MTQNTDLENKTTPTQDKNAPLPVDMNVKMQPMDYVVLLGIAAFLLLNLVLVVSLFLPK